MYDDVVRNVKEKCPIVFAITNYVTVNDCANIILASGASPIMSDAIEEVSDVLAFSSVLVINIGTLNARTVETMIAAGKQANKQGIPVILDPVGAGATSFRNEVACKLMKQVKFAVIKGNASELKFLTSKVASTSGVDVSSSDIIDERNIEQNISLLRNLSAQTSAIIVATGAIDIVTSTEDTFIIKNGSSAMSKVSGTGCMLACVIASYVAANKNNILRATTLAVSTFGLAGENANYIGSSSYKTSLIDCMSNLNFETMKAGMKIECY